MLENVIRVYRLVTEFVKILDLDLSDLVVLTEAASGNYAVTPLIAALANADKVIAVTKDSRYGAAVDIERETLKLASSFGIEPGKIQVLHELKPSFIEEADIVTNLGFVRPLDEKFLNHMKKSAVISLMCETWEYREEDLDLHECWKRGIPVLGTNEQHRTLKIFDFLGHLCLKILFEAKIEALRSSIMLIGDNRFGKNIVRTLSSVGCSVFYVGHITEREIQRAGGRKIGESLREASVRNVIADCDAVIVNTYPDQEVVIGQGGQISAKELRELTLGTMIIQFNGLVDRKELGEYGVFSLPEREPVVGHMGWTLGELGPKPVIALNSGGLKVGELLARARLRGFDRIRAERSALKNNVCQDFSADQRKEYGI